MRNISPAVLALFVAVGFGGAAFASAPDGVSYGDYLSARIAAGQHDLPSAARLYRSSLAADPNNADLLNRAFLFTAASGDMDDATALAKRILKTLPDDRPARLTLTVQAFKDHDYRAARMQLAQSAKGPFTELVLSLLDAWGAQGVGDTKAALADLANVVGQGGTDALASFHRALILDLAGRNDEADAAYKQALATGESPRVVEAYGRFLERTGRGADARAFYTKEEANSALTPLALQGLARLDAGKVPDRLVATPAAGAAEVLFGIAASLTDQTNADIATLYLRMALYLAPDLDLAKIVLADRFEALGKFEDAITVYRSVAPDSPYSSAAQIEAAVDEGKLDQNDKSIADLEAIAEQSPNEVSVWTALGDAYRSAEKYADAAGAYDHAIKLSGAPMEKDWPLYYARGVSEERSKNWPAAEADMLMALKLSPDQASVLNYLGYSWIDQGRRMPEAIAMLEKARTLSPYDGYIVDSVGWAYYRDGRYQDAAKTLLDAVLLVPGDPTINEHLGDAYWKIGRKLDAQFQWNHALADGPDDAQKAKLEEKLKDGLGGGRS
ncbi:MAG TPA: tetratricopeptide repeat protein [Rhizomicrobium sp.]|nr:tetratricopeptide repeat protein [Rhizomicrobium sp.]